MRTIATLFVALGFFLSAAIFATELSCRSQHLEMVAIIDDSEASGLLSIGQEVFNLECSSYLNNLLQCRSFLGTTAYYVTINEQRSIANILQAMSGAAGMSYDHIGYLDCAAPSTICAT